jgi:hypothetical protein
MNGVLRAPLLARTARSAVVTAPQCLELRTEPIPQPGPAS